MPAFENISSKHDIASLGSQMKFFARDLSLRANNSAPLRIVVTDFNFAIMNSVSLAFNDCSLPIYLDMIFKSIAKDENAYNNLTILATCSTHLIKFVAVKISAHLGKDKKRTVMLNFAKAIECTKYNIFIEHISEMYIVFKTENVRYNFLKNFIQIVGLSSEISECIDVLTEESDPLIEADFLPKASKYMKLSIIDEIETVVKDKLSKDQSNIVPNPFYSNKLALYTLRKLCPFTLLWSSFCHQRLSNATIEGHNKVLKCNLDTNNKKPGVAVRDLCTHTLAQILKENSGNLQPNAKEQTQRTTCIEDPVENFKTRPKPQISIFKKVKDIVSKTFFFDMDFHQVYSIIQNYNIQHKYAFFQKAVIDIKFTKSDLMLFDNDNLLNDTIICAYLKLLKSFYCSCHLSNTYLFAYIKSASLEHVCKFFRNITTIQWIKKMQKLTYFYHKLKSSWSIFYQILNFQ